MQRSSSVMAAFWSCIGSVPRPASRSGHARAISAISSLMAREVASACFMSSS